MKQKYIFNKWCPNKNKPLLCNVDEDWIEGTVFQCKTSGSYNFGGGIECFAQGELIVYNNEKWVKANKGNFNIESMETKQMENKEFIWDEKTVLECFNYFNSDKFKEGTFDKCIKEFIASKSRKPVITVEGKDLFEGDEYWLFWKPNGGLSKTFAENNFFIQNNMPEETVNYKRFLTEESARAWIADNEKKYSYNDVERAWNEWHGNSTFLQFLKTWKP
jgi:hypothetical protein